jgi:hypothetical protein
MLQNRPLHVSNIEKSFCVFRYRYRFTVNFINETKVLTDEFLNAALSGGDITHVVEEAVDVVTLNGGNSTVVKPLLDTVASVISQFSLNLTEAEESSIRGEMVKAMRIGLDFVNNMPQVKNVSAFYSLMLLSSNTQSSKSIQELVNIIWDVYQNPSIGYNRIRENDTTERFTGTLAEISDSFFEFEYRNCE